MHLGVVNVRLASSDISVQKMPHLLFTQMWTQCLLLAATGAGLAIPCRANPVNAQPHCRLVCCQRGLAALRGASAIRLGWEQLHDFAECLKQLKIYMLGKKINPLTKDQLQRHFHSSLLSCLSMDRLSVWGEGDGRRKVRVRSKQSKLLRRLT